MKTILLTSTDINGTIIKNVQIDWGNDQYTSMNLDTFQTQFPNEPMPTEQTIQ